MDFSILKIPYWSTVFLPKGEHLGALNGTNLRFFRASLGSGQNLSPVDTNMRMSGQLQEACVVQRIVWIIRPHFGSGDLERLAAVHDAVDDTADLNGILDHGYLQWDFVQKAIDIGPLWLNSAEQNVYIPQFSTFAIQLRFGQDAPLLHRAHLIRLCIYTEPTGHQPF
jgi:hypothetical protein